MRKGWRRESLSCHHHLFLFFDADGSRLSSSDLHASLHAKRSKPSPLKLRIFRNKEHALSNISSFLI